ncbi:MAG: PAS domain S-box protein [Spirochaetes bacterium]|nr:PAS domain S-box protein [Spirochaetota bacterium]
MDHQGKDNSLYDADLQSSERKYRTIFENTGTATILIEEDTLIAMVNTEFEKLSGVCRADIEGKMSWPAFIVEEDRDFMIEYHRQRRRDPDAAPRNYICRLMNSGGEVRQCFMTVALIPGTRQSVASLLDITERIKAEEALRESEEKYRLLVETMNDGLGIQDRDGNITYVNEQICRMMGYSREEIVGKPAIDLLQEASREVWRSQQFSRKKNRYDPYEVSWKNKEGEIIHTIVSPRPIYDATGDFTGSFAVFTDITARKNAEEALRLSEDKFSKAFRSSPDSITISTVGEGCFIDVNDSFLKITGYARDEVIGHTVLELWIWPDEEYRKGLIARLLGEGRLHNREVNFRVKSGEMRIGIYSAEIIELQGETCLISVFADITEQRRLEREILDISEAERRKIGQDLHDDLQQHLIGVEALSTLLEKRLLEKSSADAPLCAEIVQLLRESITKTRRMAKGLCPVYLNENALAESIRELAGNIESAFGVACTVETGDGVMISDNTTAAHLYHIIQEATTNAVRHGRATAIAISLVSEGGLLSLSVRDNGVGIPEDAALKKGLGLNTMSYRARMIGAGFDVRRDPSGGTIVSCSLNQKF